MKEVIVNCRLLLVLISLSLAYSSISRKRYNITENSPEDTLIADIVKDFELSIPENKISSLNFSLTSDPEKYFRLESNGRLRCTNIPIDREEKCPRPGQCLFIVKAALVSPRELYRSFELIVDIVDENDNEPAFALPVFNLNISENAEINSVYILPTAFDRDIGNNDIQRYVIDAENVHSSNQSSDLDILDFPFELLVKKVNSRGRHQVNLQVKQKLDRETISFYQFKVKAIDGGHPEPKTGTLTVNINIMDINDNDPIFEKESYKVTVSEDFPVDGTILTVKATDADEGVNSEIKYELSPGQWEEEIFSLNEITGDLTLLKPLDHSESSEYTLEIMATDFGPDAVPTYAKIEISVKDTNNNVPKLLLNPLTDDGIGEIHETIPPGSFALHLSAKDADSGDNGKVNCTLSDPLLRMNAFALEHIADNEFKLVTATDIDRETVQAYPLTIICQDLGEPPLSASVDLIIKVLDVDDNPPFFEKNLYSTEVYENNFVGQLLLQVRADDLDSGINATMRFSLCPESQKDVGNLVSVDEQSGKITALQSFDYEVLKEFRFCVMVDNKCDECSTPYGTPTTATADVLLKILDINDNPPEFVRKIYKFEIPENSPFFTEVGTLRAVDKDSGLYNSFAFSFNLDDSASFPFHIDPVSGKITTTSSLDREKVSHYKFSAKAVDDNDTRLESLVPVEIIILDINDNSPTFLSDCQDTKINVGLVETDVFEICRFQATDPDEGNNGEVTYSLIREDGHKLFNISSKNGTLLFQAYNLLDVPKHLFVNSSVILNITVLAKDNGNPQLSTILRTTAEVTLLQEFSMDALRERRDGYFSGRPLRILSLCAVILGILMAIVGLLVFLIVCRARKRERAQSLRPRCEVKLKDTPKDPDNSDGGVDDSADEEDKLKPTNGSNANNNKIVSIHPAKLKSHDEKARSQELKYNFSDGPNFSPMKKKGKNECNGNQFFSLSRKAKGSGSEKSNDKKDTIYKPSNDLPKKQPIFFKPQTSSDNRYSEVKVSNRDLPSSHQNCLNGRNVNVDMWNDQSYNEEDHPDDADNHNIYQRSESPVAVNDEIYPYSKVSTFFEYQSHNGSREKLKTTPPYSDTSLYRASGSGPF